MRGDNPGRMLELVACLVVAAALFAAGCSTSSDSPGPLEKKVHRVLAREKPKLRRLGAQVHCLSLKHGTQWSRECRQRILRCQRREGNAGADPAQVRERCSRRELMER
jgi:hypothetical protein